MENSILDKKTNSVEASKKKSFKSFLKYSYFVIPIVEFALSFINLFSDYIYAGNNGGASKIVNYSIFSRIFEFYPALMIIAMIIYGFTVAFDVVFLKFGNNKYASINIDRKGFKFQTKISLKKMFVIMNIISVIYFIAMYFVLILGCQISY